MHTLFTRGVAWTSEGCKEYPERITIPIDDETRNNIMICQALIKASVMDEARLVSFPSFADNEGVTVDWKGTSFIIVSSTKAIHLISTDEDGCQIESEPVNNRDLFKSG